MAQVALGIDYLLTVLKRDYNFLKTVFVILCFINWKDLLKKIHFGLLLSQPAETVWSLGLDWLSFGEVSKIFKNCALNSPEECRIIKSKRMLKKLSGRSTLEGCSGYQLLLA